MTASNSVNVMNGLMIGVGSLSVKSINSEMI